MYTDALGVRIKREPAAVRYGSEELDGSARRSPEEKDAVSDAAWSPAMTWTACYKIRSSPTDSTQKKIKTHLAYAKPSHRTSSIGDKIAIIPHIAHTPLTVQATPFTARLRWIILQ